MTEAEVKANADFMAARLAKLGWRYVVVDIEWSEPQRLGPDYPVRSRSEIDAYGRFVPAAGRFPAPPAAAASSPWPTASTARGSKFGVHIVRGVPRLAVERNTPIEGSPYRAADVVDKADYCDWNEDQWGVDVAKPGAQDWYDALFRPARRLGRRLRQGRRPLLPRRGDRHDPPGHRPRRAAHRPEPVLRPHAPRPGRGPGRPRQHVAPARRPLGLLGPGPAGLPPAPRVDALRRAGALARSRHAAARPPAGPARGLVEGRDHEPRLLRNGLPRRPRGRAELPDARRAADGHDAVDGRPLPRSWWAATCRRATPGRSAS
ncbi:MAG: hypothetical protein MZU84_06450 [Sphingobacterium sp.]|nr:hypothetical protein [Sphingobacterium sp.]